ncbi:MULTISPECIES: beta-phosphoglucomutase [Marinimicrobium]|uniref:Beta-phosphoglucomutase n=1 Tax=Marinimicrobium koreense TaxID=306545 RepID=A0A3N1NSC2_9GAMM|nr:MULTISPECIES: beta-phosphoglucomutase [Marinimicrobium]ROQ18321.1 beta-phosphoglucomutase [Marinimicrobium koreense]
MTAYRAAIFDLDGVIADTARLHLAAWQQLAEEEGFRLPADADERLKGVDRMASLEIVLEGASRPYREDEKLALADRKNQRYQQLVTQLTPADLLPGAAQLLDQLAEWNIPMALASASKNARAVIDGLGIAHRFDYIADAARVKHPKPDPEIFTLAARGLGVEPALCVGIEDAAAGVTAIKRAGMYAVGIGDDRVLAEADQCVPSLADFRPDSCFEARR